MFIIAGEKECIWRHEYFRLWKPTEQSGSCCALFTISPGEIGFIDELLRLVLFP